MKKDKRITISLTQTQYEFVKKLAILKHEYRISAAIREIIDEAIKKAPEK